MKKFFLITFTALTLGAQAHAVIIKAGQGNNPPPPPMPSRGSQSLGACSDYLYQKLTVFSSTADQACEQRTDANFQDCVVATTRDLNPQAARFGQVQDDELVIAARACNKGTQATLITCTDRLTPFFGNDYRLVAANYCTNARASNFAQCVGKLYATGGMRPEDSMDSCNSGLTDQMLQCVTDQYRSDGRTGKAVVARCKETYDPAAIARREAEKRRIEEERVRKEAAAREAARQAAQRAADEAKRKADEAKKNNGGVGTTPTPANPAPQPGGVGTTPVPQPAPQPSNPAPAPAPPKSSTPPPAPQPLPQDPAGSGGGVIVDLPNF